MNTRTGIGYDIHRIDPVRPLVLGGVHIPQAPGLRGHSDADVVIHAICDALLGAAAMGDIGELFPDTDPAYAGIDSRKLLADVAARVRAAGFQIANIDCTIFAEAPRLSPHKAAMRRALAETLQIRESSINVKAGTNEGLDAVGRREAIACQAIATLAVLPPPHGEIGIPGDDL